MIKDGATDKLAKFNLATDIRQLHTEANICQHLCAKQLIEFECWYRLCDNNNNKMSSPPLYDSFEENASAKCVFCKQSIDDRLLYGDKYIVNGITFHNFCLVSKRRESNRKKKVIVQCLLCIRMLRMFRPN